MLYKITGELNVSKALIHAPSSTLIPAIPNLQTTVLWLHGDLGYSTSASWDPLQDPSWVYLTM